MAQEAYSGKIKKRAPREFWKDIQARQQQQQGISG